MSIRATKWAWLVQTAPTAKSVLVALADHADETGLCWPSLARLRLFTCLSERAIRNALRDLEVGGLMVTDQREGMISRYTLRIGSALPPRHLVPGSDDATPAPAAGDPGTTCPPPRHEMPGTPAPAAPEPPRTIIEPSVNPQEVALRAPRAKAAPKGHRLPEDWAPSLDDRAFAEEKGLDPNEVAAEFRDYWTGVPGAKGMKLDWNATFRNSVRMQAKRRQTRREPESKLAWVLDNANFGGRQ